MQGARRLQIRLLRLRIQEGQGAGRPAGGEGLRRFPRRQVRLRIQGQGEGIEADRDDDAEALRNVDEQEEDPKADEEVRPGMPDKEGQSAEEDREVAADEFAVLQQAQPPVRDRKAGRAPAHRHKLSLLWASRREAMLSLRHQGRVDQRDRRLDALRDDRPTVRHRDAAAARFGRVAGGHDPPSFRPGMPLHVVGIPQIPFGPGHMPIDVEEGQLLGQRAHGELLRPRQGRAPPKEVLDVRRCRRRNRGLHRLLQQLEAAGWSWQDDAFGIQGLLVGKAHMPSRPPPCGERKREPLARDSRFSIGRFLNVSLTWGPHYLQMRFLII